MHLPSNYSVLATRVQVVFMKNCYIPAASSQLEVEHVTLVIDKENFLLSHVFLVFHPILYLVMCRLHWWSG